jgi:hypothetical protein
MSSLMPVSRQTAGSDGTAHGPLRVLELAARKTKTTEDLADSIPLLIRNNPSQKPHFAVELGW